MKKKVIIKIYGIHCRNCRDRIHDKVELIPVEDLEVSYEKEQLSCITEDPQKILYTLENMGYKGGIVESGAENKTYKGVIVGLSVMLGFYIIIKNTIGFNSMPDLKEGASYPILFFLGLVTSLHCLSMCGGIVLSQSIAFKNPLKSSLLYNLGRVVSYTLVGGVVGGIGSVMSFSPQLKGYIIIFAGDFMILMGLSMLETFSFLKKFIKLPPIVNMAKLKGNSNTPLIIGFATGIMPCGPLQTMQIYALGTGSVWRGALAMFIFSLGTVPLMLGLGTLSGYISSGFNRRLLKVSALLVMVLGLIIVNRGLALQGRTTLDRMVSKELINQPQMPEIVNGFQVINTSANNKGYEPNFFILEKGRTVKWMIKGDEINSCNNEIMIPTLEITQKLQEGHNVIEFTPQEEGELGFSCWMGMLKGQFIIVEDLNNIPDNITAIPASPTPCCTR